MTAHRGTAPSRTSNPFATCWTRPGALPFHFAEGESAAALIATLAAHGWWGEIIGPHGSGKSTLLATLAPQLAAAGRPVRVVDGYDGLAWIARWQLRRRCRRMGHGLLVTAHQTTGLPKLVELSPSLTLVQQLASELSAGSSTSVSPVDVAASYAKHGGNAREILFDLYDRHEALRRRGANGPFGRDVTTVGTMLPQHR
jgi:hypothetical protein